MDAKPRKVRGKIKRNVTEIAIVTLDRNGNIEEVDEVLEELNMDDASVESIHSVLSVHG